MTSRKQPRKPIEIDLTDQQEVRGWERLFGDPMWRKFISIQEASIEDVKTNAWVTFRTDKEAARGIGAIEALTGVVQFEHDVREAMQTPPLGAFSDTN